jgi:hypothetical protein
LSEPLQFDNAEPVAQRPAEKLACTFCRGEIAKEYFEVNGRLICGTCQSALAKDLNTRRPGRFIKAAIFGLGAGALGAAIYYAVAALTGYEFGLIGVLVGFLVGIAVRKGSRNRGGRAYQVLAAVITYVAIVSTYVPFLFKAMGKHSAPKPAVTATSATQTPPANALDSSTTSAPATSAPAVAPARPSAIQAIGAIFMLFGLILALPFLGGASNLLGLGIIGFSLYEAWKLNRRAPLAIRGPFSVGTSG